MEPNKKILKEVLFAFQLGMQVIGSFVIMIWIGLKLDEYFSSRPVGILFCLFIAFLYIMKTLLGVGKK